ncbi:MAG TPA: hypothetical protein PJ982_11910, partial [Lacipirellulaceae bacterium]|nr:hypothetical protein [Lacipirellulaceae bacterium]
MSRVCQLAIICLMPALAVLIGDNSGAQTLRGWVGPAGGDWFTAAHWGPAGVPDARDILTLGMNDRASSASPIAVSRGGVIAMGGASQAILSHLLLGIDGVGTLGISASSHLQTAQTVLGLSEVDHGAATITGVGSIWEMTDNVSVGHWGHGSISVTGGAAVVASKTDGRLVLGEQESGAGVIDILGPGSLLRTLAPVNPGMVIGERGRGSLQITEGAQAELGWTDVGAELGSRGDVLIRAGYLFLGGDWNVGKAGTGGVSIVDGGYAVAASVTLGTMPSGDGRIEIRGIGRLGDAGEPRSYLAVNGSTGIGQLGAGTLIIAEGGLVDSWGPAMIATGSQSGVSSIGRVEVLGVDSQWRTAAELQIGVEGQAVLSIHDGGAVSSESAVLGSAPGGKAAVTVSGAGSMWAVAQSLAVGSAELTSARLVISHGGQVTSKSGAVGRGFYDESFFGPHSATVAGAGSSWEVTETLAVGDDGRGALFIADGGRLVAHALEVATIGDSVGRVLAGGLGTTIDAAELRIGATSATGSTGLGGGWLHIGSGSRVTVSGLTKVSPSGLIVVEGGTLEANHFEGDLGGGLRILYGDVRISGQFNPGAGLLVGHSTSETAQLTVTGQASSLVPSMAVGVHGKGIVRIERGRGLSVSDTFTVGVGAEGVGEVVVEGPGAWVGVGGNGWRIGGHGAGSPAESG